MRHEERNRLALQECYPSPRDVGRSEKVLLAVHRIQTGYYLTDEVARITAQKMIRLHGPPCLL